MKEEDKMEREAMERRLRRDLVTKTFPKTREDFDQLFAMVKYLKRTRHGRIIIVFEVKKTTLFSIFRLIVGNTQK